MKIFRFKAPSTPWGDYGRILHDGMVVRPWRDPDDVVQLQRTGPFIPSITFPGIGDIIVTARTRDLLTDSNLRGFSFRPVSKARVARVDWHLWDRSAERPAEYPEDGEPEGYILDRPHCESTAAALGELWELRVDKGATEVRRKSRRSWSEVLRRREEPGPDTILIRESSWTGADFFRGAETRYRSYVSDRAHAWLKHHLPGALRFVEVETLP